MSMLSAIVFDFVVSEGIEAYVEHLNVQNRTMFFGPSFIIKINPIHTGISQFSITQPRRFISITTTGYIESVDESSTRIKGEIKADFVPFIGITVASMTFLAFVVLQGDLAGLFFAGIGILILAVASAVELARQYYAKLSAYTFLKRL